MSAAVRGSPSPAPAAPWDPVEGSGSPLRQSALADGDAGGETPRAASETNISVVLVMEPEASPRDPGAGRPSVAGRVSRVSAGGGGTLRRASGALPAPLVGQQPAASLLDGIIDDFGGDDALIGSGVLARDRSGSPQRGAARGDALLADIETGEHAAKPHPLMLAWQQRRRRWSAPSRNLLRTAPQDGGLPVPAAAPPRAALAEPTPKWDGYVGYAFDGVVAGGGGEPSGLPSSVAVASATSSVPRAALGGAAPFTRTSSLGGLGSSPPPATRLARRSSLGNAAPVADSPASAAAGSSLPSDKHLLARRMSLGHAAAPPTAESPAPPDAVRRYRRRRSTHSDSSPDAGMDTPPPSAARLGIDTSAVYAGGEDPMTCLPAREGFSAVVVAGSAALGSGGSPFLRRQSLPRAGAAAVGQQTATVDTASRGAGGPVVGGFSAAYPPGRPNRAPRRASETCLTQHRPTLVSPVESPGPATIASPGPATRWGFERPQLASPQGTPGPMPSEYGLERAALASHSMTLAAGGQQRRRSFLLGSAMATMQAAPPQGGTGSGTSSGQNARGNAQ